MNWIKDKIYNSYHLKIKGIWLGTVSQCFDEHGNLTRDSAWLGTLSGEGYQERKEYINEAEAKKEIEERVIEILKELIT